MNKFSSSLKGFTLIEITLVLGLTLGLAAALIFGLSAFQKGSDRAKCLMNISNVQKAVRSWANLNEIAPGTTLKSSTMFPDDANGTVYGRLWGEKNSFLGSKPYCPRFKNVLDGVAKATDSKGTAADGGYNHNYVKNSTGAFVRNNRTVPEVGSPYLNCVTYGFDITKNNEDTFHHPCEIDGVKSKAGIGKDCKK